MKSSKQFPVSFQKVLCISILTFSLNNVVYLQLLNEQIGGDPIVNKVEQAPIASGSLSRNVNLFTGLFETSYNLGTVTTPAGLSFTANLSYSSSQVSGTSLPMLSGVPYGDGWGVEVPMITVGYEDLNKWTLYDEFHMDSKHPSKTKNYYDDVNNSCRDGQKEGELHWFQPQLTIPGIVSGSLVFKYRNGIDYYFVMNKFDRYIEVKLSNHYWEVTLDDGTVYEFAQAGINHREPIGQRLQNPCFSNTEAIANVSLPKSEIVSWYCTTMYKRNSIGEISFVYQGYGCFDLHPLLKKNAVLNNIFSYLGFGTVGAPQPLK
jgi:hypothetical protein